MWRHWQNNQGKSKENRRRLGNEEEEKYRGIDGRKKETAMQGKHNLEFGRQKMEMQRVRWKKTGETWE